MANPESEASRAFREKVQRGEGGPTYDNRKAGAHAMWKSAESCSHSEDPQTAERAFLGRNLSPVTDIPAPGEARTDERGDAWLVEQVRSGNDQAFSALVMRYERKLIRVLMRLVHDQELAR